MNAREDITTTAQTHGWAVDGTGSTIGMTRGVVLVEVTFSRSGQVTQALRIDGDIRTDVLTARDAGKREAVVAWLTRHTLTGHPREYGAVDAVADDGIDRARVLADHPLDDDEARGRCIPHDNDPRDCEECAQVIEDIRDDDTQPLAYEMFLSFDPAYHADTYSQVLVIPGSMRPVIDKALTDHVAVIASVVTGGDVDCGTLEHDGQGGRRARIRVDDDDQSGGVVTFRRVRSERRP